MGGRAMLIVAASWIVLGCQTAPPVVNVEAPPCQCACDFKASAPQIGRGCHVQGDVLICPLVVKQLEIEPAYPSEDRVARRSRTEPCAATSCRVES